MARCLPAATCVVAALVAAAGRADAVKPTGAETALARRTVAGWLGPDGARAKPPFSFVVGGKPSADLLPGWKRSRTVRKLDGTRTEHTVTHADPDTGLVVECRAVAYRDFPTVEWVLRLTNVGTADTPIIEAIRVLDMELTSGNGEFVLHHNRGSMTTPQDYEPLTDALGPAASLTIGSEGGRPLNTDMPYFHIQHGGRSTLFALGWPGDWSARFVRDEGAGLRVTAGQKTTHFVLHPGESVRTPLVAVQFALGGDAARAQNIWRRWMIAHNLPRPGGKPMPPIFSGSCADLFPNLVNTQADELAFLEGHAKRGLKIDYWWRDAGWYPCGDAWWNTGTWEADPVRYPDGLKIVADRAHALGWPLTVWFEPERAVRGSWLDVNHPEWLIDIGGSSKLLNLGNPDALKWVTDHIDRLITENRIDMYRQDFNMDPAPFWARCDTEDRQGIAEIRHVEGLLAFWDELKRRHPKMPFDNCASGGRRNCLEMMRRGLALSKTDYAGGTASSQCQLYGIAPWLPYYGAGVAATEDRYVFRSNIAPWTGSALDTRNDAAPWERVRGNIAEWRRTAPYLWGDFYPLTPYSLAENVWMAWQFDNPQKGNGIVQAFRRPEAAEESIVLKVRGLRPTAAYEVTDAEGGPARKLTGCELMEQGLQITLRTKPSAALFVYKLSARRG